MKNEADIVRKAQAGDQKAIDTLIESVRFLVYKQAHFFKSKGSFEERVNAGFVGALEAIQKCDCEKGTFANIAYHYINNRIRQEVYLHASPWTIRFNSLGVRMDILEIRAKDEPITDSAIALKMAMSVGHDFDSVHFESNDHLPNFGVPETLTDLLSVLDERSRTALVGSVMQQRSLKEVGLELGLSGERVRQLRDAALLTLREECQRRGLDFVDLLP